MVSANGKKKLKCFIYESYGFTSTVFHCKWNKSWCGFPIAYILTSDMHYFKEHQCIHSGIMTENNIIFLGFGGILVTEHQYCASITHLFLASVLSMLLAYLFPFD